MKTLLATSLVLMCGLCAALTSAAATPRLDPKTATEAQYRAVLADILAATNAATARGVFNVSDFAHVYRRKDLADFRAEADEALAGLKYPIGIWCYPRAFPKAAATAARLSGASTNLAYTIALANRLGCNVSPQTFALHKADADELARSLGEWLPGRRFHIVNEYKMAIQRRAAADIKRRLREQGRSFVKKNGVDPVKDSLERLNAALNAPRFSGLNEWLADLGYTERVDLSRLPSDAEVAELRRAVLFGEKPLSDRAKTTLFVCLGVDAYNAFVKEYNGD